MVCVLHGFVVAKGGVNLCAKEVDRACFVLRAGESETDAVVRFAADVDAGFAGGKKGLVGHGNGAPLIAIVYAHFIVAAKDSC